MRHALTCFATRAVVLAAGCARKETSAADRLGPLADLSVDLDLAFPVGATAPGEVR